MLEPLLAALASGGAAGAFVYYLAHTALTERLRRGIAHEYDAKLEQVRADLLRGSQESLEGLRSATRSKDAVSQTQWETKRDACLAALRIVDGTFSHIPWDGVAAQKQPKPGIDAIRDCHNRLALSCEARDVLDAFKACLGIDDTISADLVVDLRSAIRGELGFGRHQLDHDRDKAWIAKVNQAVEIV